MAYSDQQIKDYAQQQGWIDANGRFLAPGVMTDIGRAAQQNGVDAAQLSRVFGAAPWADYMTAAKPASQPSTGTVWDQYLASGRNDLSTMGQPASGAAQPYTSQQINDYIDQNHIGNDYQAIHDAAAKYGVSGSAIDAARGYAPGTADAYTQSHGWSPLTGSAPAPATAARPAAAPGAPAPGATVPAYVQQAAQQQRVPSPWPGQQPQAPQMSGTAQQVGYDTNPYLMAMGGSIAQQLNSNLNNNILPQINGNAQMAGGFGGSRQGVAQGLAAQGTQQAIGQSLAGLYGGQWNNDQRYNLDAYNANMGWMRQGQQDQLDSYGKLLGMNQQYGVGNATQIQNTPMNYWQQFMNGSTQAGGLGNQQTQNLQGNPMLGAFGGYMLGSKLAGG